MAVIFFQGGEVAAEDRAPYRADVLVRDGVIEAVGEALHVPVDARVIDVSGKIVSPAMFDAHVHMREPGQEAKETIKSGSEAAINGGVTGVVLMPNTAPAIDSAATVKQVLEIAARDSRIPIYTSGCITKGRAGEELAPFDSMKNAGVLMLTDDGDAVENPSVLKRAMEYGSELGLFFASHCETEELSGPRALNEGAVSYRLGIPGSPASSEEICMDRDIRLAHAAGAHVHIQHVSSAIGMETIRWWKQRMANDGSGAKVTAEVCPHHLLFADEDIGDFDTHYKMNPPLRTRDDNAKLVQGLIDGVFDLISTDHAPHTPFEKSQDFVSAPNGITGLETALVSLFDKFVNEGVFGWDLIVKRFSAEPRRMMQLPAVPIEEGTPADLIVFDPAGETTFTAEFMKSKSQNTPFLDKTLKGRVDMVVLGDDVLLER